MVSGVIWPWAEANPGLLSFVADAFSLVALVIACLAFLNEMRSGQRAAEARLRGFIDVVLAPRR
ncbi:MAG: hypothetical protein WDM85_09730 [Caulobacteraceae bacterium]